MTDGPFRFALRVRYAECDQQGVVFNAHYLAYCDHALTELWRATFGGYESLLALGLDTVVAEAALRFRASARFDDELEIELRVAHIGRTSLVFAVTMRRHDEIVCEADLRYVFIDVAAKAKTEIPAPVRAVLARYGAPDDPGPGEDAGSAPARASHVA